MKRTPHSSPRFLVASLASAVSMCATACGSSGGSPSRADARSALEAGAGGSATGAAAAPDAATGPPPVVPGCGADTSQGDGSGAMGTYTVPVDPALAPFASFTLGGITYCESGGAVTLSYKLPALLLGRDEHVTFTGALDASGTEYVLSSAQGTARCKAPAATWACREALPGIAVDFQKLDTALAPLSPDEASARRQVAMTFGQDPIGVLEFPTR